MKCSSTPPPPPPQPVHMVNSPLGATVPDRVKSQIWADEYVEFAELVHRQSQRPASLALTIGNEGYPAIAISPATRLRQIRNIDQWTTALLTFGSIYAQRNPSRASGLFKYCEIVCDIAQMHGGNMMNNSDCTGRGTLLTTPGTSRDGTSSSDVCMRNRSTQILFAPRPVHQITKTLQNGHFEQVTAGPSKKGYAKIASAGSNMHAPSQQPNIRAWSMAKSQTNLAKVASPAPLSHHPFRHSRFPRWAL